MCVPLLTREIRHNNASGIINDNIYLHHCTSFRNECAKRYEINLFVYALFSHRVVVCARVCVCV